MDTLIKNGSVSVNEIQLENDKLIVSLRSAFKFSNPELERGFVKWLSEQTMLYLRAHVPYLCLLYVLLSAVTFVYINWFTAGAARENDLAIWQNVVSGLFVSMVVYAYCVGRPSMDKWFPVYSLLSDCMILASITLAAIMCKDQTLHQLAQAVLVVGFLVIFGTGLQRLKPCLTNATIAGVIVVAVVLYNGQQERFQSMMMFYGMVLFGMTLLATAMERSHRIQFLQQCLLEHERARLSELSGHLSAISRQDALTGLANRRRFDEQILAEWERAKRESLPLSLLFIDVDHFKKYNDTLGHQAGDLCLQQVARTLHAVPRRSGDLVARYGGEEFVVLLPNTDANGALHTARRILKVVTALNIPHPQAEIGRVSVSVGCATVCPQAGETVEDLIAWADRAVYVAKERGRNQLVEASDALSPSEVIA